MSDSRPLPLPLGGGDFTFGQILARCLGAQRYELRHRDDADRRNDLEKFDNPQAARLIARCDDADRYRALKTAPNLRRGWVLAVHTFEELIEALDCFYPGRLAAQRAHAAGVLRTTALRDTLNRQTGIYRVAAAIRDDQLDDVVGDFCRSQGGCLRTILWRRDSNGAVPSTKLPQDKYDPAVDQTTKATSPETCPHLPLLCQEACNLLVAECRRTVKQARNSQA